MEENENNQDSESTPTQQKGSDISPTPTKPQPPTTLEMSNTPSTPQKRVSKKLILIGLVLLIIVLIISGLYFYLQKQGSIPKTQESSQNKQDAPSPTSEPTASWKTYTNNLFGFTLKYPDDFIINNYEQTEGEEDVIELSKNQNDKETSIHVSISDTKTSKELYLTYKYNVENRLQKNGSLTGEFNSLSGEYKKVSVDSYEAYQLNLQSEIGFTSSTLFEKDSLIFAIQILSDEVGENEIFDQILSTFRFLPNISNWKTYSNENLGISFKYPTDYSVSEENGSITSNSPSYLCREKQNPEGFIDPSSSPDFEPTSELYMTIASKEGKSYSEIWFDSFGFEFLKDELEEFIIDGKTSYYFTQGAEMSFSREAYLVEINNKEAMQIEVFLPIYQFECKNPTYEFSYDPKYQNTASQILSTFRFDSGQ